MEIKINREIRSYTESVFFGLSMRQFIFSVLACAAAAGTYYFGRTHLGTELLSWACVLAAVPFVILGFVQYHGMTVEQFLWVWIKSEILMPKHLVFRPENLYYEITKSAREQRKKEGLKSDVKNRKKDI